MKFKEKILNSPTLRYLAFLALGVAVGAVFYPTKRIEEKMMQKYEAELKVVKEKHESESNQLKERLISKAEEEKKLVKQYESKLSSLQTQITELKSKTKTAYYKLVKPDGTIEIKKFTESEVSESTKVVTQIQQEFKEKIDSIEKKWSEVHEERVSNIKKDFDSKESEYKKELSSLKQSKVSETNKKRFGAEVGITNEKNYYGHVTGDVVGPVFIGVHGEAGPAPSVGAGVGLRF